MTAIQLIHHTQIPVRLVLFDKEEHAVSGIAYNAASPYYLLNVPVSGMSAFPDQNAHLLDWLMMHEDFQHRDREEVKDIFLSRNLYGEYLRSIWDEAQKKAQLSGVVIELHNTFVKQLEKGDEGWKIFTDKDDIIKIDTCVIASGNQVPRHPNTPNKDFIEHKGYVRNPWSAEALADIDNDSPVFILGNSLTMVDTLIGLTERKFNNKIITLSPKGFIMLPHEENIPVYEDFIKEVNASDGLYELVAKFNKHKRILSSKNISILPLIDSIRPYTQEIWLRLSLDEKRYFMTRMRNFWNAARHRIPSHIHQFISHLSELGQLRTIAGRLLNIFTEGNLLKLLWWNSHTQKEENMLVGKLINCTGPETNFTMIPDHYLTRAFQQGLVDQEPLLIGLNANGRTYAAIDRNGNEHTNLFILGPYLKGILWETTAVSEIREQARSLAIFIADLLNGSPEPPSRAKQL